MKQFGRCNLGPAVIGLVAVLAGYAWAQSFSGEFVIDTVPWRISIPGEQRNAAVTCDGTNYLVVWENWPTSNIRGARLGLSGTLLDPGGLVISTTPEGQGTPAVTSDGAVYFVVWADWRISGNRGDIYGTRVSPGGTVLDPDGIAISVDAQYQYNPAVAFDGANFLVVWEDGRRDGYSIYGARVTPDGTVLDSSGIAICTRPRGRSCPAVASEGTNCLVVWEDQGESDTIRICGARLDRNGRLLDTTFIVHSAIGPSLSDFYPSVACDGGSYFVVWQDGRGADWDIYGSRVTGDGVVLDTTGIPICTWARAQTVPQVAFGDTNYLVVWRGSQYNPRTLRGVFVSRNGQVRDTGFGIVYSDGQGCLPALCFDGENFLVVWNDSNGMIRECDVRGTRISQAGARLDRNDLVLSAKSNLQSSADVAFDGMSYLVVWADSSWNQRVYGARIGPDGTRLEGRPFEVGRPGGSHPKAAHGDTNYLAVWEKADGSHSRIWGCLVSPDGRAHDNFAISSDSGSHAPAVVSGDTRYFAVWDDGRGGIYGTRVRSNGEVVDPAGIRIAGSAGDIGAPAVAFDGTYYLVVWQARQGTEYDIRGARVRQSGQVLDTSGFTIAQADGDQLTPKVSYDGANYVVVWEDRRGGADGIYAARVSRDGLVLDPGGIPIRSGTAACSSPELASDGTATTVLWTEVRGGLRGIYGAKLNSAGVVLDSFPVAQATDADAPALAHGSGQQMLAVYSAWAGHVQGVAYNTDRIWAKLGPFPGVAEGSAKDEVRRANCHVEIHPNPAKSYFITKAQVPIAGIRLYDVTGKEVRKESRRIKTSSAAYRMNLDGVVPGVYLLRIGTALGDAVEKLIVSQ